jgi:hypothetical protein
MDRIDENLERLWNVVRKGDVAKAQADDALRPYSKQSEQPPFRSISMESSAEAKSAAEVPQHVQEERDDSGRVGSPTPPPGGMITSRNDEQPARHAPSPAGFGPGAAHMNTVFEEPARDQSQPIHETDPRRFIQRDPTPEPQGFMRRLLWRLGF